MKTSRPTTCKKKSKFLQNTHHHCQTRANSLTSYQDFFPFIVLYLNSLFVAQEYEYISKIVSCFVPLLVCFFKGILSHRLWVFILFLNTGSHIKNKNKLFKVPSTTKTKNRRKKILKIDFYFHAYNNHCKLMTFFLFNTVKLHSQSDLLTYDGNDSAGTMISVGAAPLLVSRKFHTFQSCP